MNKLQIDINGDFHQFEFSGPAQDLIDSASFSASGRGSFRAFPPSRLRRRSTIRLFPGHLGQVWLGTGPEPLLHGDERIGVARQRVDLRAKEFGSSLARCFSAGTRIVLANFELYEHD